MSLYLRMRMLHQENGVSKAELIHSYPPMQSAGLLDSLKTHRGGRYREKEPGPPKKS